MLTSVSQAISLFFVFSYCPIKFASALSNWVGDTKEDKNVWVAQTPPHIFDIGMFLGDMPDTDPAFFSPATKVDLPEEQGPTTPRRVFLFLVIIGVVFCIYPDWVCGHFHFFNR